MAEENVKPAGPTYIHGIGSSQAIDTAGEIVDLAGLDCSSLVGGAFNWEHKSDVPAQIVGKILEYKKIFSEADCDNDNHKYFWDKCKTPFLYVMGRLFDDKKDSAKECAALFMDDAEHPEEQPMVGLSIEGSKISKKGIIVDKSIARKTTITNVPANKTCVAEMVKNPDLKQESDADSIFKSEPSHTIELLEKYEPLNKARVDEGKSPEQKVVARKERQIRTGSEKTGWYGEKADPKGVHTAYVVPAHPKGGTSVSGAFPKQKEYNIKEHKKVLAELKQMPKPDLGKKEVPGSNLPSAHPAQGPSKAVKGAPGWSHTGGGNFHHPEHGIVSVVKQGPEFHVKHRGALAGVGGKKGVFGSSKEAGGHAGDYMRSLSQGKTVAPSMHERPSPSMGKSLTGRTAGMGGRMGMMGGSLPPESTDKKNKRGLFNPDVDKITTRGTMMGGGMGMGRSEKKGNLKKAMTAGSGMATPGNLVQGAALAPESVDKKMKKALWFRKAEECYKLWEKREQFENFMAKHLPGLTKGEISAIGATLALRKSMRAEAKLKKMMRDEGQDSWVKKKEK